MEWTGDYERHSHEKHAEEDEAGKQRLVEKKKKKRGAPLGAILASRGGEPDERFAFEARGEAGKRSKQSS